MQPIERLGCLLDAELTVGAALQSTSEVARAPSLLLKSPVVIAQRQREWISMNLLRRRHEERVLTRRRWPERRRRHGSEAAHTEVSGLQGGRLGGLKCLQGASPSSRRASSPRLRALPGEDVPV